MADSNNPEPRSEAVVLARILQISALSLGIVEPRPAGVDAEREPQSGKIESSRWPTLEARTPESQNIHWARLVGRVDRLSAQNALARTT